MWSNPLLERTLRGKPRLALISLRAKRDLRFLAAQIKRYPQYFVNPILRKLSRRNLPRKGIARLLRVHVGDGLDAFHSETALAALNRIRDPETNAATRVLARLVNTDGDACKTIREVIRLVTVEASREDRVSP